MIAYLNLCNINDTTTGHSFMSKLLHSTPQADGFRMPAEFEHHAGCWMLFPQRPDVWRENAAPAQAAFTQVATAISRFEPVTVGVSADLYLTARQMLPEQIRVVELTADDAWMRDCGPTFVVNDEGAARGIDWEFNAWGGEIGGLYDSWEQDNLVAQKVIELAGVDRYKAPFVVEGGAIHVDGEGTLITTSSCLLNENRNPNLSKAEVEDLLMAYLNVSKIIWLDFESYEETDGHVDGICAFVRQGELVVNWCDDPDDVEYEIMRQCYQQLENATDAKGRKFNLHKIPAASPAPLSADEAATIQPMKGSYPREAGEPIGGTYVNFYIANGGIIMPTYNNPNDEPAKRILSDLFPDREIIGVPAREIALGGGMIHCITQQQPSGQPTTT